ncbi:mechanosensitive ion channel family protein [Erythrobacter sp. HL-111]|uniref:mechanosensitive ion channel family protein n=1 Tax=Erythrobacter sp. HL-111 TaxID=1798193 RepID=UPI0006DA986E|nr:mechanosensitive ion channel family protein [Erythrobacter sp. HL-111]KPP92622.1 MAG: hypothetical protein HLUCCO15_07735 [Erythrobacteraceae bacterium HL-111]
MLADPAPDVEILDFNERGTVLAVRPYCHTDHYWQVFFDTNKLIAFTFGEAGYSPPFTIEQKKPDEAGPGAIAGDMLTVRIEP